LRSNSSEDRRSGSSLTFLPLKSRNYVKSVDSFAHKQTLNFKRHERAFASKLKMSYAYIANIYPASTVQTSIACTFCSEEDNNLIVAKGNRLEIYRYSDEEGCILVFEELLNGRIAAMNVYRGANDKKDSLVVLVERKFYCIFSYDDIKQKLVTKLKGSANDRVGKDLEDGKHLLSDPNNRVIGMRLVDGLLKILPIEQGPKECFNVHLRELRVLDITFLHNCLKPTICVLYQDMGGIGSTSRHIKTYTIETRDKELGIGPWQCDNIDYSARKLVDVPTIGGVLVIGISTIIYINSDGQYMHSIAMNESMILATCTILSLHNDAIEIKPKKNQRFLLGDYQGSLYSLMLHLDGDIVSSLSFDIIGTTSIPQSISYISNDIVFIGSVYGDSQLIHVLNEPSGDNLEYIEVLDTYDNIGPIVDMSVVKSSTQGQNQLITCSGSFKDGSLRIIRAGIGISEQASMESSGIKGIWSLHGGTSYDKYLVHSFINETRVLEISGDEMGETIIPGFANDFTLFCADVPYGILQVTSSSIRLIDVSTLQLIDEFFAPSDTNFTVACTQLNQIAIGVSGGTIILFELTASRKLKEKVHITLENDIACMSMGTLNQLRFTGKVGEEEVVEATLLAVGTWTDATIRIYDLPSLDEITNTTLNVDVQARDILLACLDGINYLLCGLGDGTLITYELTKANDGHDNSCIFGTSRRIAIGTRPIQFSCFFTYDKNMQNMRIFVTCDRPTVIYSRNKKLLFSIVNISEVSNMTPFSSEVFPDCLAMVTENNLIIGTVDSIQQIHVKKHHIGDDVKRICHNPTAGLFIVLVDRILDTAHCSFVLFLDDCSFEEIYAHRLESQEWGLSIIMTQLMNYIKSEDNDGMKIDSEADHGKHEEYAIVGTAFMSPDEQEPKSGNIYLFRCFTDDDGVKRVEMMLCHRLTGAVFCLSPLNDTKLIAGIGNTLQIFRLISSVGNSNSELDLECEHPGHMLALYIKTYGDLILLGDVLHSVSLLQYHHQTCKVEIIARDFNAHSMRGVSFVDEERYLCTEDYGNIIYLSRNLDPDNDEDNEQLIEEGEFHLGDYVNVFVKGSLISQPTENVITLEKSQRQLSQMFVSEIGDSTTTPNKNDASILFGTTSGAIGICINIDKDEFRFFSTLENCINNNITPIGGLSHHEWRNFHNEHRVGHRRKCIDGELVEKFLVLDVKDKENIIHNLNDQLGLTNQVLPLGTVPMSVSSAALSSDAPTRSLYTVDEVEARLELMQQRH
jgi:DNA damage-binding protein 1